MTSRPIYHWTTRRLTPTEGRKSFIFYLFDETGTLQGHIKNTKENLYEAFVGVPSTQIGLFDTVPEAKGAILYCLTGEE